MVFSVWFPVGSTAGHLFIWSDDELTVSTCVICSPLLIKAYFELCGEKTPKPFWDHDGDSTITIIVKMKQKHTFITVSF